MYPFKEIEKKWQHYWRDNQTFQGAECGDKPKKYVLEMLPYPSGKLHMGHVRNYAIGDGIARFLRLQGYRVLHPMGFDAFGLPAENAASQNGTPPKTWTLTNIAEMRTQLQSLGFSYNWDREIHTCMPNYYTHQQKLFKAFYEKGLLIRKESWVNFDPVEQSVLANEQVINGRGWRSNALVEKRLLKQWSCSITAYADELLDDLETLTKGWPAKVLKMQENWIGKSQGALIHFSLHHDRPQDQNDKITVFSTRPDTLFGCAFIALSPEHPLTLKAAENNPAVKAFIDECRAMPTTEEAMSTAEKKGVALGLNVIHPFDGTRMIAVYAANFVLMDYGTGAVFGCPAHDERDFEFATLYNLPIIPVISHQENQPLPYTDNAGLLTDSDFLNGLTPTAAIPVAIQRLVDLGAGEAKTTYRLRDWLVSRQRYWGCPIPIIHCADCGIVPVPDDQLPVLLPDDVSFDKPGNPLDHHPTWKHVDCPLCHKPALRETDTLDTFVDSSWYFMRYTCSQSDEPIVPAVMNEWGPVDYYIGGVEHAVMHLLYARFFTKVLRDLGYVNFDEPFKTLLTQGMVCHETYQDEQGQWCYPFEVEQQSNQSWIHKKTQKPIQVGSAIKMSKSKKNLIDPLEILECYGADVARLFILSDTPYEKDFNWNTDALEGCWRYMNRLIRLVETSVDTLETTAIVTGDDFRPLSHQFLQKTIDAYTQHGFNKVIAYHREFTKTIEDHLETLSPDVLSEALSFLIMTLEPIAPHFAHEAYWRLFHKQLSHEILPTPDQTLCDVIQITMAVQVNGKLRGTFDVQKDTPEATMVETGKNVVQTYLAKGNLQKTIYIPNRLINFIII